MREHLTEKKTPDPLIGARIDDLQRYHRAYKRAFVHGNATGIVVWLLGRALGVPEDVRSEDDGMVIELLLALVLSAPAPASAPAPVASLGHGGPQRPLIANGLPSRLASRCV